MEVQANGTPLYVKDNLNTTMVVVLQFDVGLRF